MVEGHTLRPTTPVAEFRARVAAVTRQRTADTIIVLGGNVVADAVADSGLDTQVRVTPRAHQTAGARGVGADGRAAPAATAATAASPARVRVAETVRSPHASATEMPLPGGSSAAETAASPVRNVVVPYRAVSDVAGAQVHAAQLGLPSPASPSGGDSRAASARFSSRRALSAGVARSHDRTSETALPSASAGGWRRSLDAVDLRAPCLADGSKVCPLARLRKMWCIRNTGARAWHRRGILVPAKVAGHWQSQAAHRPGGGALTPPGASSESTAASTTVTTSAAAATDAPPSKAQQPSTVHSQDLQRAVPVFVVHDRGPLMSAPAAVTPTAAAPQRGTHHGAGVGTGRPAAPQATSGLVDRDLIVPGAEALVSVEVIAPATTGRFYCEWRLQGMVTSPDVAADAGSSGGLARFGPRLWIDVDVVGPAAAALAAEGDGGSTVGGGSGNSGNGGDGSSASSGGGTPLAALLVEHVSVPHGMPVDAGATFVKTWRLRNTGAACWAGCQLVHFADTAALPLAEGPAHRASSTGSSSSGWYNGGDDALSGGGRGLDDLDAWLVPTAPAVAMLPCAPGTECQVSMAFKTVAAEGALAARSTGSSTSAAAGAKGSVVLRATSAWRLVGPSGAPFGPTLAASVVVTPPGAPADTATTVSTAAVTAPAAAVAARSLSKSEPGEGHTTPVSASATGKSGAMAADSAAGPDARSPSRPAAPADGSTTVTDVTAAAPMHDGPSDARNRSTDSDDSDADSEVPGLEPAVRPLRLVDVGIDEASVLFAVVGDRRP